jgi:protein AATF/BFR2
MQFNNAVCKFTTLLPTLVMLSPQALAAQGSGVCGATTGTAPPPPPAAPDTSDAYWAALSSRYEALAPFRDAAIDRWHARAVLGSGSAALNGRLRALHQSVSKQVANVMQDPAKLIARSRLATGAGHRHLGAPAVDGDAADGTDEGYGAAVVRDEETFDDGDFYQQLLQEFLDRGGSGGGQLLARPPKKRKLVDRRASKGRKIRWVGKVC